MKYNQEKLENKQPKNPYRKNHIKKGHSTDVIQFKAHGKVG